jgi:eukaryotic-like serine/threonine-protein kinase
MVAGAARGPAPEGKARNTLRFLQARYRLEAKLAAGGMGTVYRATDERLKRRVAVKLLRDDLARDAMFVERFRREARSVAALAHPNIATVFDYGEEDGCHFIVMELAEGRDLARVLREDGRLPSERTVSIAEQICDALGHAHSAGVIHRDVKPANVIVGQQDLVKVTDFGIARATGDATLTATGLVLGSAHYISPEQANGVPATPASDIYSLGIVIYEMLTGALPFTGESPVGVAMRHVTDDVPAPSALVPDVPPDLDAVVARATARAPEGRWHSAPALANALQSSLGGTETSPLPSPAAADAWSDATEPLQTVWPIPGDRWDPNRIGRIVAIVFGLLAAVAIALLFVRLTSSDDSRSARQDQGRAAVRNASAAVPAPASTSPTPVLTSVVGQPFHDAERLLHEAGFEVGRNDVPSEDVERDVVIAMTPEPGSTVEPGATITLTVSTGPEKEKPVPPGHGGKPPPGHAKKAKKEGHDD